jgi:tetratricopeptide (TPR) repeat protein
VLREYAIVGGGSQAQSDQRFRQSTALFEKCVDANPTFASARYELGVTLRAVGDYQQAISSFQKTIDLDKNYTPAYFGLGLAMASAGDLQRASMYLKQFIEREPTGPYADDARAELRRLEAKAVSTTRTLKTYTLPDLTLRYPDDWVAMKPEEVAQRAKGNMVLTPECVLVIANPDNWGQNVNVQITDVPGSESVSREQLKSFGESAQGNMAKQLTGMTDFSYRIITVAGIPSLELNFSSVAWGKKQRQRSVMFVTRAKLYNVTFTSADSDFADADAKAFRSMLNTHDNPATQDTLPASQNFWNFNKPNRKYVNLRPKRVSG